MEIYWYYAEEKTIDEKVQKEETLLMLFSRQCAVIQQLRR